MSVIRFIFATSIPCFFNFESKLLVSTHLSFISDSSRSAAYIVCASIQSVTHGCGVHERLLSTVGRKLSAVSTGYFGKLNLHAVHHDVCSAPISAALRTRCQAQRRVARWRSTPCLKCARKWDAHLTSALAAMLSPCSDPALNCVLSRILERGQDAHCRVAFDEWFGDTESVRRHASPPQAGPS